MRYSIQIACSNSQDRLIMVYNDFSTFLMKSHGKEIKIVILRSSLTVLLHIFHMSLTTSDGFSITFFPSKSRKIRASKSWFALVVQYNYKFFNIWVILFRNQGSSALVSSIFPGGTNTFHGGHAHPCINHIASFG